MDRAAGGDGPEGEEALPARAASGAGPKLRPLRPYPGPEVTAMVEILVVLAVAVSAWKPARAVAKMLVAS